MNREIYAAARKYGLLATTPKSEKVKLLVLSNEEHADNQEAWFKTMGLWECRKLHCRNCSVEQQDECYDLHNKTRNHIGVHVVNTIREREIERTVRECAPTCARREAEVRGMTPEPVQLDIPLADGCKVTHLYFDVDVSFAPRRGPGRPKAPGTPEERRAERARRLADLGRGGWTMDKLAKVDRSDLLHLASKIGIHDPARAGTNDDLRRAIAKRGKSV